MENKTTIQISHELWKYINDNKIKPGETPEDVIWSMIKNGKEKE